MSRVKGSEKARDALFTPKGFTKSVKSEIVAIREEMRSNGLDREADSFYSDAMDGFNKLVKALKYAT